MAQDIKPAFYWDLSDVPKFVKSEFRRRVDSIQGSSFYSNSTDYSVNKYTHPSAAWVRVCSNSVMRYGSEDRSGFVMTGLSTGGFKSKYGFEKGIDGTALGYTADGKIMHRVSNERFKHRPSPGIVEISSELSGGDGKFRITTMKWKCWSTDQLEYMTPYWLTNSVSVSVEFGWNNFNPMSELPLSNVSEMLKHFYDGRDLVKKVELSNGNYDASMGVITKFSYDLQDDGSYDCTTVIQNVGGFFSGVNSTGRSSDSSKSGDSKNPEWKKFIEDVFSQKSLGAAHTAHASSKQEIESQVFYSRDKFTKEQLRGKRMEFDFDKNTSENWFISFGLFIKILNDKMSVMDKKSDHPIFKINIDDVLISAHPNLKSGNGNVLLVPNSTCPDISLNTMSSNVNGIVMGINEKSSDPELDKANAILQNTQKSFNSSGSKSGVRILRYDLNKIINWWADSKTQASLSFPLSIADPSNKREKKHKTGYLKNLYINAQIIKDLKSVDSFKSILDDILKKMSAAAGGLWDFRIVPLDPNGSGNGMLTIMDQNYMNFISDDLNEKIWNFDYNNNLSIVRDLGFSVKSSDAVATQTLFGKGTEVKGEIIIPSNDGQVNQSICLPIGLSVSDRLMSGCKEVPPKPTVKTGKEKEPKDPLQDRVLVTEAKPLRFLYSFGDRTFSLVEHVGEVQTGLIYGGEGNSLRLNALQPGIVLKFNIMGISGLRNLHTFTMNDLPAPYGPTCFFQIQNVQHSIVNGDWSTSITAGLRRRPPELS